MAKKKKLAVQTIKLSSTDNTGFLYYTKKNFKTKTGKIELKKYDPIKRKHVTFKESGLAKNSAK